MTRSAPPTIPDRERARTVHQHPIHPRKITMPTALTTALEVVGIQPRTVNVRIEHDDVGQHLVVAGIQNAAALRETTTRIRSSLNELKILPRNTIVVLDGERASMPSADLAIAIAILVEQGVVPAEAASRYAYFGELGYSGKIVATRGLYAASAFSPLPVIAPAQMRLEASHAPATIYLAHTLQEVIKHLTGAASLPAAPDAILGHQHASSASENVWWNDVPKVLTRHVRRGLEIAAVSGLGLLCLGNPGSGATFAARALAAILPPADDYEMHEALATASVAGIFPDVPRRPFRAPHHTCSEAGMLGGGSPARPGEVSLAHAGVLLLDEIAEWRASVLDQVRTALLVGDVTHHRGNVTTTFPSAPANLVATAMPCPCGHSGSLDRACTCTPKRVAAYLERFTRLIGPAIGIHLRMDPYLGRAYVTDSPLLEPIATVRARILAAWNRSRARGGNAVRSNLATIARAIADLDGAEDVTDAHRTEAAHYAYDPKAPVLFKETVRA